MKIESAVLLAGGRSSRMGTDKSELLYRGVPLIEYQVAKLQRIGMRDIVISGCARAIPGTRSAPDEYPARGPLGGIHAGLLAIRSEAALVIGVDTPLLPEALLTELVRTHRSGITAVSADGRIEPLIAVYDRALAARCECILLSGQTAVRRLFDETPPRLLPYTGDPRLLMNCNTPADYRLLTRGSAGSPPERTDV